jgi:putative oxidoreductase
LQAGCFSVTAGALDRSIPQEGTAVPQTLDITAVRARFLGVARKLAFLGPTLARLTVGLVFIGTGWGKLHDLQKVTAFFTDLHIPAPAFQARLVACTELVGGIGMLLGLATRLLAIPLATTMVVAILTAKRADIDGVTALVGFEEWSYLVLFIWLALAGPGPLSLDHLIARRLERKSGAHTETQAA